MAWTTNIHPTASLWCAWSYVLTCSKQCVFVCLFVCLFQGVASATHWRKDPSIFLFQKKLTSESLFKNVFALPRKSISSKFHGEKKTKKKQVQSVLSLVLIRSQRKNDLWASKYIWNKEKDVMSTLKVWVFPIFIPWSNDKYSVNKYIYLTMKSITFSACPFFFLLSFCRSMILLSLILCG